MAPPTGFSDLYAAYNAANGAFLNVIGVVVDLMAPTLTRTGEHLVTFKILDPRLRDATYGCQGLTVRFFKKDREHLPRVSNLGDIALLRNIKATPFKQQPLLLANYQTSVVVFPGTSIPDPTFQLAFQGTQRLECLGVPLDKEQVTLAEQSYVIALKHDMQETVDGLPSTNVVRFGANGAQPADVSEPRAKRTRLSEPALSTTFAHTPPAGPSGRIHGLDGLTQPVAARAVQKSSFGPKFKLVTELAHFDFADICAEVIRKYPLPYGGCDLYVTDYTSNKDMWYYTPPEEDSDITRDGDMFGYSGGPPKRHFPGPYEWNVLKVNVKDPHAHFVNQKVGEGDFVLLRNVKMKIMREGAKLEGDMWPDSKNREKVQVSKLMNHRLDEIQEILLRKEKYWASRNTKLGNQESAKLSKAEKNKKKRERKAEKKAAEAGALDALLKEQQSKADINPHVRCSHDEVPITSVKDILDPSNERHTNTNLAGTSYVIPFINAKYRARVRVVDYRPKALEDFAVPADATGDDDARSVHSIDGMDWEASQKWIWSFRLLVEDASSSMKPADTTTRNRLWLTFTHENAQYLFGNTMPDPSNLCSDAQLLAKLREKLWNLWGNLEERESQREGDGEEKGRLSNRAFECCVMEYGVPVGPGGEGEVDADDAGIGVAFGYRRCYGAFGVTIM